MSTTVTKTRTTATERRTVPSHRAVTPGPVRKNPVPGFLRRTLTGGAALFWTAIVVVPIYWLVVTSLRSQSDFTSDSPLALPSHPTLDSYRTVLDGDFTTYLLNSVVVTAGTVVIAVAVALMAAFSIVRNAGSRFSRVSFRLFLLGLAIPLQAVIIPVYLLIIRMHLYDSLLAIVLPSAAFALPITVMILVSFLRDVPRSLFEAMIVDGAGDWRMLWSLAAPLARPALMTVAVYDGLQVWNGFLFPLILTQSGDKAVLPLALTLFRGQFGINVPATMAAVVLSTLPMLALFILARRQLVAGLTAGFSK
ncbi:MULTISPECIES: carbohydrate ABC transporter permease [unclassified Streptomyces]|uniref:carbohydrate ABC transporter permease n=1 Tax=unclassified Streptomyces TaxID=2593676 RepID=UPI00190AD6C0|nr:MULTISPECIES: carbohydrate ABC transporter permease [unclassified Streptomyces]MBK3570141.1 carbohydrate ABC transporter permease [Streptomyces sp. MBT62]MBK6011050.1 carbohydrate ABC transporter permease [Streptomyces sp. MBT53]